MPLRIAFDLDGLVADMEAELLRQAEILFGDEMRRPKSRADGNEASPSPDPSAPGEPAPERLLPPLAKLRMTMRQQRRLWRYVETIEGFWESLNEIESGMVSRLAALAADRKWEVIFLTNRPECAGATAQVQSQRWLASKGFIFPSVYVVQESRGRIAAALGLDFVVDDRPENCLDVLVESKAKPILVWREDEKRLPAAARRLGIGVVKSVNECLDILTDVDSRPREQPATKPRPVFSFPDLAQTEN